MLLVIVVAPPWMLFAKPLILKQRHEALTKEKKQNGGDFELSKVGDQVDGRARRAKQRSG